jgi:uncharacterized protein
VDSSQWSVIEKVKDLDSIFELKHNDVFAQTDCLTCGNCCRNYSPIIEPEEIPKLILAMNLSSQELFTNYVEMDDDGDFVFKSQPCPNLDLSDNKCKIYENRPKACSEYPHTNMKKIKDHLDLLQKNVDICPAAEQIVYSVLASIQ